MTKSFVAYGAVWALIGVATGAGALNGNMHQLGPKMPLAVLEPKGGSELTQAETVIKGTAPEHSVSLMLKGSEVARAKVDGQGRWTMTLPTQKLLGTFEIVSLDSKGTPGERIKETFLIKVPQNVNEVADPEAKPSNSIMLLSHDNNGTVYAGRVIFEGRAEPGAVVTGYRDQYKLGQARANESGIWSIESNLRAPGQKRKFKFEVRGEPSNFTIIRLNILR